jgi:hypothetical protein
MKEMKKIERNDDNLYEEKAEKYLWKSNQKRHPVNMQSISNENGQLAKYRKLSVAKWPG